MNQPVIQVNELYKTYKDVQAVKGISFRVHEGEIFAFLGPNGAGKSTTIHMLTSLVLPTAGEVKVGGYDVLSEPEKVRWEIGVALQDIGVDPDLTGRELLELQGRLFGFSTVEARNRASELLGLFQLTQESDRPCGTYSGGMKRRLDLALTLVHRPNILFLDEPTSGLDPANRKTLWEEIRRLNQDEGTTIFLTTHYMEEAEQLADQIQFIGNGQIVASGTPEDLKQTFALDKIELLFEAKQGAEQAKNLLLESASFVEWEDQRIHVFVENSRDYLPFMIRTMSDHLLYPTDIQIEKPTLDDVFLKVTNQNNGQES